MTGAGPFLHTIKEFYDVFLIMWTINAQGDAMEPDMGFVRMGVAVAGKAVVQGVGLLTLDLVDSKAHVWMVLPQPGLDGGFHLQSLADTRFYLNMEAEFLVFSHEPRLWYSAGRIHRR